MADYRREIMSGFSGIEQPDGAKCAPSDESQEGCDALNAEHVNLRKQFYALAGAVGWSHERCAQTGDSPLDCAHELRAQLTAAQDQLAHEIAMHSLTSDALAREKERVQYYENALCPPDAPLVALQKGSTAKQMAVTRVCALLERVRELELTVKHLGPSTSNLLERAERAEAALAEAQRENKSLREQLAAMVEQPDYSDEHCSITSSPHGKYSTTSKSHWYATKQQASAEPVDVDRERLAQMIAHRACCGTEHDPVNGKFHGYCVVCGVPWPCKYVGPTPDTAPHSITAACTEPVDIVFDGPPGPEAGRFVEVENADGRSIKFGEWIHRPDGYWALRIATHSLAAAVALAVERCAKVLDASSIGPDGEAFGFVYRRVAETIRALAPTLSAEAEAMIEDAERYRYARKVVFVEQLEHNSWYWAINDIEAREGDHTPEHFDAAIDKARGKP